MAEDKQHTRLELEESLNEQQKRFCESRLFNNRVQAYMIAYPDCPYKSASASATRLLEDVRINQYIELLKLDIEEITGVSKAKNLRELAKIAYNSIEFIKNDWIEQKDWEQIKKDNPYALAAVESIDHKSETKTYNKGGDDETDVEVKYVKVKLFGKIQAIQEINKMQGYNEPERIDQTNINYNASVSKQEAKEISDALENEC